MKKFSDHINKYRIKKGTLPSDDSFGITGSWYIPLPSGAKAFVVSSEGMNQYPWEHVSVSILKQDRCSTWEEMCYIKSLFWNEDEAVVQIHPAKKDYVDNHKYCLHLWRPKNQELFLPPSILMGYK